MGLWWCLQLGDPQSRDLDGYGNGMEPGAGGLGRGKGEWTGELYGAGRGVKGRLVCWREERSGLLHSNPLEPGSWAARAGDGSGACPS